MPRRTSRRTRRQHGTAYLEALILLPVFAVLCVAALGLGRSYEAQLRAGQQAREAAWRESASGCGQPAAVTRARAEALAERGLADALRGIPTAFFAGLVLTRHDGEDVTPSPHPSMRTRILRAATQRACNEAPAEGTAALVHARPRRPAQPQVWR